MRGALTLFLLGLAFLLADLTQRLVIAPSTHLLPRRRLAILTRWMRFLSRMTLSLTRLSGAKLPVTPTVPGSPQTLLLMNHQSLLDVPLVVQVLESSYPVFVTRRRYAKGVPLISHLLRLGRFPLVDPGRRSLEQLDELKNAAAQLSTPLLIFPEGTRSRDGAIGPFKRGGLRAILTSREWSVYLVVVDGLWKCGKLRDFVANIGDVQAELRTAGPFPAPTELDEVDSFAEDMRSRMISILKDIRESQDASSETMEETPSG